MKELEELKFNVSEIFFSIQGEGSRMGKPCVFVRMQGCNLRCSWCDTPYALDLKEEARIMSGKEIAEEIQSYNCNFVEFTGGEPLWQKDTPPLMAELCNAGYVVAVETNGSVDTSMLDSRIIRIIDIKCPSSKMNKAMNYKNLESIQKNDEVKFVVGDRNDFVWALEHIAEYKLFERAGEVLFSPVFGKIENRELAEWVLEEKIPARMQLQIHKYIWEPDTRGV